MTQRYSHPLALARMEDDLCPECGSSVESHLQDVRFWMHDGCSLLQSGVIDRIRQYREDQK